MNSLVAERLDSEHDKSAQQTRTVMANEEHVALLKQGVDAWNEWRRENPDVYPDLSKVDLRGTDLRKVDLREANLDGANLSEADLRWVLLCGADLCGADLSGADTVSE
jgi:uncharacterized protein YjbI with pentapeptide repeats